jgi:hypothetical protein
MRLGFDVSLMGVASILVQRNQALSVMDLVEIYSAHFCRCLSWRLSSATD